MRKDKFFIASAPGRLDVMGGFADYSGSRVLQMPIRQQTTVHLRLRHDFMCNLESKISTGETLTAQIYFPDLLHHGNVDYAYAQKKLVENPENAWVAYVLGCVLVLMEEKEIVFCGADFQIESAVPLGKGVSSSASLEIAVMKALSMAYDVSLENTELPLLAQRAENQVAGAPCGLMDQLACYFGEPRKLLPIVCQPDCMDTPIAIPGHLAFIGIDSGVRHFVGGSSYTDVRCAAFMGYTMIARQLGFTFDDMVQIKRSGNYRELPFGGYLSNMKVERFEEEFSRSLPDQISGKDFLDEYQGTLDEVTRVNPTRIYSVKTCTAHPVYENERVNRFMNLLKQDNIRESETVAREMGQLMYQSHESYTHCGLGSPRTDHLVKEAKKLSAVYGAKITGGGSGGTVCLLLERKEEAAVRQWHEELCSKFGPLAYFDS
jgi:galactokinase